MQKLTGFGIEKDGYRYELNLGWDEAAFEDGDVSFNVDAAKISNIDPDDREVIPMTVSVVMGEDEHLRLKVSVSGETVFNELLSDIVDAEEAIDQIPAWVFGGGDPITGCLIRSGLSAVIGQALSCNDQTRDSEGVFARLKEMSRCLLHNIPDICGMMAYKSAWCIARFGF